MVREPIFFTAVAAVPVTRTALGVASLALLISVTPPVALLPPVPPPLEPVELPLLPPPHRPASRLISYRACLFRP